MKKIQVKIREKDKGIKDLTLLNLRDEIVNFLYKDTIANSTKSDLQFYVLFYFISIQIGNKTFLEKILDEGIPKFNKLNEAFGKKKGYLKSREYRQMVNEYGLSELFENDIFFILVEAILNIKDINKKFDAFLKNNLQVKNVVQIIRKKYAPQLNKSFTKFISSKIEDDRYDEYGNFHDLSKSVYRTVRMRNSRNFDLNLQKYTSIEEITSKSPIDLTFLQHVNPQIIFDLWDKYHVAHYMKSIWDFANSPVISQTIAGSLIVKYTNWKRTDGKKSRAKKNHTRKEFEDTKRTTGQNLGDLTLRLVDSILEANKTLEKEIENNRKKLKKINQSGFKDKEKIKKLEERIRQLENLSVTTRIIDDK